MAQKKTGKVCRYPGKTLTENKRFTCRQMKIVARISHCDSGFLSAFQMNRVCGWSKILGYYYYKLQLSCHSVAVGLTLVQTKQIRINIHKWNNTKKHSTNNTKHSQYNYTYYQNTHTLQNKLKQPQYKIHPDEMVTI